MKTKIIQVNGKPEVAYAIIRNSESITCDYSCLMGGQFAQAQRDVFSIYFQNWKFTFLLELQPAGTVLTLDNIARIDYKLQLKHLKSSGCPEMTQEDFERLKHAYPPQLVFDNTLVWSWVVILLPSTQILKESVQKVELPDGRRVEVKIPKGKTLTIEGAKGGVSPIKALTQDELEFVDRIQASEKVKSEPLTIDEKVLLNMAMKCPELDKHIRRPPSHWQVFLAAWKEGMNDYDMERRKKWPRKTASNRLRAIERDILHGQKVSGLKYDDAVFRNVEAQIKLAREHNARSLSDPAKHDMLRTDIISKPRS